MKLHEQSSNYMRLMIETTLLTIRRALGAILLFSSLAHSATVPPEYFGLHIHRADSSTAWPQARFGSWRLWDAYVQWTHLQPEKGKWEFQRLDRYVKLAAANHVSLLLPLGLSPGWASSRPGEHSSYGEGRAAEPKSMDDWRTYVRTVAWRYKGKINAYEIWNEPNDKAFFSGSTTKLVELTCEAYSILKATDPNIVVVSPAYTGAQNIGKLETFLAYGGKRCIDVVAYHLYVTPSTPEAIPPLVQQIQQAMKRQDVGQLPLWNTETGWFIENSDGTPVEKMSNYWLRVSAEQSASFVARSFLLGSASGVERFYWYSWDSKLFGLIEPTAKSIKSGGLALDIVAKWMIGNPQPVCAETNSVWHCALFSKQDERHFVVWSTEIPTLFTAPIGWRIADVERADGRAERLQSSKDVVVDDLPRQLILTPIK